MDEVVRRLLEVEEAARRADRIGRLVEILLWMIIGGSILFVGYKLGFGEWVTSWI